jgi:uncharacterized protein YhbP (UPF0306 family)
MSEADVRSCILSYLADHVTMTLAVVHNGQPHAATLFYASEGLVLFFLSSLNTAHSEATLATGTAFVTVSQDYADWRAIQGLQMRGSVGLAEGSAARDVYFAKFPFVASFPDTGAKYWRFAPSWIRFTDNTQGFAHKDEIEVP